MDLRRRWSSPQSEISCEVVIFWFSWSELFIVVEKWKFARKSQRTEFASSSRVHANCRNRLGARSVNLWFLRMTQEWTQLEKQHHRSHGLEEESSTETIGELTRKSQLDNRFDSQSRSATVIGTLRQLIERESISRYQLIVRITNHSMNQSLEQSTKSICYHRHQQQAQLFGFPFGFPRPKLHFRFIEHEFMFDHRFN